MDILCATVQSRKILDILLNNANYIADIENVPDNLKKAYQEMMKYYDYKNCPIFLNPIDYIGQMYGASVKDDSVIIKFKIPSEFIRIQKYYNWTDFIYFLECREEFDKTVANKDYNFESFSKDVFFYENKLIDKETIYQLTTEVLKPEWLVDYFSLTEEFIFKYIQNGGKNILTI